MQTQKLHRTLLGIFSLSVLFLTLSVILTRPSYAQETLVCPTPAGNHSGSMQMTYCYVVTPTAVPITGANQANSNNNGNSTSNSTSGNSSSTSNGIYTSNGSTKTSNGCSQTCNPGQTCQQLCGNNGNAGALLGGGSGGIGSLFSGLPILNFILPGAQAAPASNNLSLSPLSSFLGGAGGLGGGTKLVGNSNGTFTNVPVNSSSSSSNSSNSSTSSTSSSSSSSSSAPSNSLSNLASQAGTGAGGAINGPGGSVCQADSFEGGEAACKCPDYQELSYVCADEACASDGGINAGAIMSIVPGMPQGANCIFPAAAGKPKNEELRCVMACNSKPVIYLYPTKTTSVNVQVAMQGHVTVSDPHYNLNGWQNVVAQPNGQLTYNGKKYQELYYESDTIKLDQPKTGMFIDNAHAKQELLAIGTKLGLNATENDEFASYWSYRLKQLNTPYTFFSVFNESEKLKVDDVQISPKPDTFIGFLAYFKPVAKTYAVEPLQFPSIPARNGFTAVEWGGTLEQ